MSLKAFHVVFVVVSTLMMISVGVWSLRQFMSEGGGGVLTLGLVTLASAITLVVYGVWFLKKTKEVSYL